MLLNECYFRSLFQHVILKLVCCYFIFAYKCTEYLAVSYKRSHFCIYQLTDELNSAKFPEMIDTADEAFVDDEDENWDTDPVELDYAECTYSMGYIEQAVFICLTCFHNSGVRAGICRQCSQFCHVRQGHEVYNIGIKQHFRCDCGSEKFPSTACTLQATKSEPNDRNVYNHNFENRWCFCGGEENRPMYQCLACLDWFHGTCIGEQEEEEKDFVCENCVRGSHSYLEKYPVEGTEGSELPVIGRVCRRGRFVPQDWEDRLTREDKLAHFPNKVAPVVQLHRPAVVNNDNEEDIEFSDGEEDEDEDEMEEGEDGFVVDEES
jgi:hypothetical protein